MTRSCAQWFSTPVTAAMLRGAIELENTRYGIVPHRLPAWARRQWADPQLLMAEAQPSGVRICFRTEATAIELEALPTRRVYAGLPPRPDGTWDLVIDGRLLRQGTIPGGRVVRIDPSTWSTGTAPRAEVEEGRPGLLRFADLPAGSKEVEIWLPHDEAAELFTLRSNAALDACGHSGRTTWLHHGSSISHGSNARHPTGIWPAVAARLAGVDLLNLGFGGSALLDPFVARTIRDQQADVISLKLGINVVNMDLMRLRGFGPAVHGFLDTIRDGHETTPLLVLSPILCPIHEDTPGPSLPVFSDGQLKFQAAGMDEDAAKGKLTLRIIRDVLADIVTQRRISDPNIHYLDGRVLYGGEDHARLPLPDGLHPDGATHALMGERFAAAAFGEGRPFA
ncbi:SGNH/GDSL hydrolase family protein [Telluria sp. Tellsp104]